MTENITPIRQQYLRIKRQYPQSIVFFRLGDFYETFDEDARIAARELEIVLTSRGMGKGNSIPMAGIPYHAVDNYLARLITRGYKVAICEQMTRPGDTRGIVQREVVRLVTPGTVVEPGLLSSKVNNYLVSLVIEGTETGLAYADITTGEFAVTRTSLSRVASELERLKPSEILVAKDTDLAVLKLATPVTRLDKYDFDLELSTQNLKDHFGVATLDGFGCGELPLAVRAAGSLIQYLKETQKGSLAQLGGLVTYSTASYMALDAQTQTNLELFAGSYGQSTGKPGNSLLAVVDLTHTPMGGRVLRKMLGQPLLDIDEITRRLDAVQLFFEDSLIRSEVIQLLTDMTDLERLVNRVVGRIASPREVVALKRGLAVIPMLKERLPPNFPVWLAERLKAQAEVTDLIERALVEQPPPVLAEGGVIRPGFSAELDELRVTSTSSKQYLANLEQRERERTGIKNLKVGYNHVFGYYLEVSNSNLGQVPQDYIRKQTLINGERFFTPELKEYEVQILHAQERIAAMESEVFQQICFQIAASADSILEVAGTLANIDVFSSLAEIAVRNNYVRPGLDLEDAIVIKEGRHPVVERNLLENNFVPNDTLIANADTQVIVLTGPNMSGKSTYLRQVALIVLMAQIGSFVPATSAQIGLVDRIFTRIGAGEDLAAGKSTFMVEMTETANILNNATSRSLIILDEIGRGTSTYDGLAIARAVVEYIHNHPRLGAKTLFATHYHELVELAEILPRVKNFNVAVSEEGGEIVFLRKILPGGVDKSYGVHVAKLAGLPRPVIQRAQEVLMDLEGNETKRGTRKFRSLRGDRPIIQMTLFDAQPALLEELAKLDIDAISPLEALNKLYELQRKARQRFSEPNG